MIIRDLQTQTCTMRKDDPTWRFALAASPISEGHIVRVVTQDGTEGFGYASATAHMGAIQGSLKAELEMFRPLLLDQDPRRIEAILIALDRAVHGAAQAKA